MTTKITIRQYVIFTELRKFDTANIKCFTVGQTDFSKVSNSKWNLSVKCHQICFSSL